MPMRTQQLPHFSLHLLKGRWMVVVLSFYVMSCAGATYIFGVYSGSIKKALNYDQETIDTLSFFKDLGANVGIVSGLLNEVTPSWVVLAVGAAMNLFGYLMIWLAVTERIARPPVWQMYLFMCVGANSQTFANTGVLVRCVKNFPQSRGVVLGLLKGFVGLSGAIFTQIYLALYGQDTRGVILLVGWLPSLVSLLVMFFIRPMKPVLDENEGKQFSSFLYLALVLAAFLMAIIIVENQVHFSSTTYKVMGMLTVMLVLSNLSVAVRAELTNFHEKASVPPLDKSQQTVENKEMVSSIATNCFAKDSQYISNKDILQLSELGLDGTCTKQEPDEKGSVDTAKVAVRGDKVPVPKEKQSISSSSRPRESGQWDDRMNTAKVERHEQQQSFQKRQPSLRRKIVNDCSHVAASVCEMAKAYFANWPNRGNDFTIPQALLSLDMWILFIATTCGMGSTLTAIDNMGQIGEALGYAEVSITTCVSLISIWNFLGRVLAGFASESLLQRYKFPRTLVLTIVMALACAGNLLIAFPAPGTLYVASILTGLCFGAQWPLVYAIISELFGLKYYATLYNFGAVASPLGTYLLNVRVAGYLYDREARRQHIKLAVLERTENGSTPLSVAGSLMSTLMPPLAGVAPSPSAKMGGGRSGDLSCTGARCFRLTFLIMTVVSCVGSLISAILVLRTRKFYSHDIYAKFRKQQQQQLEGDQAES